MRGAGGVRDGGPTGARGGISAGPSGGAAVWAAVEVARRLGPGKRVVALIPDAWDRYTSVERPRAPGLDFII